MRVVFETPPVFDVTQTLPNGKRYSGKALFRATLYAPDEKIPEGVLHPTVARWRATSLQIDGSLQIRAPQSMVGPVPIPAAVIPAAVISSLPGDHLLTVEWLHYGGAA